MMLVGVAWFVRFLRFQKTLIPDKAKVFNEWRQRLLAPVLAAFIAPAIGVVAVAGAFLNPGYDFGVMSIN